MFAGMMARPRATSSRTNSGVIGFASCDCQFADWFGAGVAETEIVPVVAAIVDRGAGITDPGYSATHVLANRDEFHFGRDDATPGVRQLRNRMTDGCAQRSSARRRAGSIERWTLSVGR